MASAAAIHISANLEQPHGSKQLVSSIGEQDHYKSKCLSKPGAGPTFFIISKAVTHPCRARCWNDRVKPQSARVPHPSRFSKGGYLGRPAVLCERGRNCELRRTIYDGGRLSWDAEGKVYSVDNTEVTHDALGRMVEKNVSGTVTQIVYGPTGEKMAIMSGQVLQKALIQLPAGATAVYTSTGLVYRHSDHLGSSRLATTSVRTHGCPTLHGFRRVGVHSRGADSYNEIVEG